MQRVGSIATQASISFDSDDTYNSYEYGSPMYITSNCTYQGHQSGINAKNVTIFVACMVLLLEYLGLPIVQNKDNNDNK